MSAPGAVARTNYPPLVPTNRILPFEHYFLFLLLDVGKMSDCYFITALLMMGGW